MTKAPGNILLVDDDEFVLLSIKLLLEPHFASVKTINNPERIQALLDREQFDVIVLDMNFRHGDTTGNQGRFWLKKIKSISPDTQVILVTAYGDIQVAVESMKEGALDFIVKPWQNEKLLATVKTANLLSLEKRKVKQLKSQQKSIVSSLHRYELLIGISEGISSIRKTIEKVAPTEAEVLILGQNGTGKEVIAREIHRLSKRAEDIFMTVDVGALSENLFESELFGHRKGAFTDAKEDRIGRFEAAAGGTLFLDEIANLSLPLQAKLLTVLQHKKVVRLGTNEPIDLDVRIVCATNGNLRAMVQEGKFREDLFYRINTVEITVAPLHDRPEDIPLLADHFLSRFSHKYQKSYLKLSDTVMTHLQKYRWPGNIRELQHAIERAVIMCEGQEIQMQDLGALQKQLSSEFSFDSFNLEKLEAWAIRKAIAKHQGNISHAADELGLSRGALYRRMQLYGI
ncbi:sigma-54-dependent transcriptional regulator [Ohtaekwangia koreensis]|uniref:DNA-binding transcriptional response regulator, NtrC family, contains REC, AAA-type ATPase, and a Fis-type DNA-binding domains n=1 Tax=Ohtaekwangia koreensis TaxID=688867 RepID=A0A1T5JT26_9BACT|nr:sigma-54 dependent transcriptional regulator [Ohtaekwangia koreensis]SKC54576.1 DNA-binding transcriptional response regulator, NtrC family, contains REC, AAA-type ATPase, and a Fis-type DNA-binding domains [Ohtaekwangia koreensis]